MLLASTASIVAVITLELILKVKPLGHENWSKLLVMIGVFFLPR
jgi:hypothetical protein